MNEKDKENYNFNDDLLIDIKELTGLLWIGKFKLALITALFFLVSVIYSLQLTDIYRSDALLVLSDHSGNNISLPSRFNGLASMAGVQLSSDGNNKTEIAVATIKSREFLRRLLDFNEILPSLLAVDRFNTDTASLIYDDKIYNSKDKKWVGNKPSNLDAYSAYIAILSFDISVNTGLIKISIEHPSPVFAKEFLDLIIEQVNELARKRDIALSSSALDYLNLNVKKTQVKDIKLRINELIESQLETLMLSNIKKDYLFTILDKSFVPEHKIKPFRSLIVLMGTLIGLIISSLYVLFINYYPKKVKP